MRNEPEDVRLRCLELAIYEPKNSATPAEPKELILRAQWFADFVLRAAHPVEEKQN